MVVKFDLPQSIPVFPLPGALLLPRSCLPLHIFEPRYLAMLDDALKTPGRLIGMVQPCTCGPEDRLHHIGCAGRITQFSETEDGRYMITLSGVSRFRILDEIDGFTPYRRCNVSWEGFSRDLGTEEADSGFNRQEFLNALCRYFTQQGLETDWETLEHAEDELLINSLSMMLDLDPADKQALLEAPCLCTRRETLVTLIEYALHSNDKEEPLQ